MQQFVSRLNDARRALAAAPSRGDRMLPLLRGLNANGTATRPLDSMHAEATDILVESSRCFEYGANAVLEVGDGDQKSITYLTSGASVATFAPSILANLFSCVEDPPFQENEKNTPPTYFPAPTRFVKDLLLRESTRASLPPIETYASRPIYSPEFGLLGPGYHPPQRTLVHGPDIEPATFIIPPVNTPILERVPPCWREALRGFAFRSEADVANTIAAVTTSVLANLFTDVTKPIMAVDGNQSGVGKTLLARTIGYVLEGREATLLPFTPNDEELEKKFVATLVAKPVSVLILDNAKRAKGEPVTSAYVETLATSPRIGGRLLGESKMIWVRNDLTVYLTMNSTRLSPDLTTRSMPIRLAYEGDAAQRDFGGHDPVEFARTHRSQLLAEILGMIEYWVQRGMPRGSKRHRCAEWAAIVGGIMEVCGFPEFLENAAEAAAEFDAQADQLAALAENVYRGNTFQQLRVVGEPTSDDLRSVGAPAGRWRLVFERAGVLRESLEAARSEHAQATLIGNFLRPLVGRRLTVADGDTTVSACLRVRDGHANAKFYYFVFGGGPDQGPQAAATPASGVCRNPQTADDGRHGELRRDNPAAPPASARPCRTAGNEEAW